MTDLAKAAGWATIGLGLSQALAPRTAARAFGLPRYGDETVWILRLLGISNVSLGAMGLDADTRSRYRVLTTSAITAEAAATAIAGARRSIPARTAVSVLGFLAGVVVADLTS